MGKQKRVRIRKWGRGKGMLTTLDKEVRHLGYQELLILPSNIFITPAHIRYQFALSLEQRLWFPFTPTGWRDNLRTWRGVSLCEPPSTWPLLSPPKHPLNIKSIKTYCCLRIFALAVTAARKTLHPNICMTLILFNMFPYQKILLTCSLIRRVCSVEAS